MLKFDINKDDINILTNHFNLSQNKFESEIKLLKTHNENSGNKLTDKMYSF